MSSRTKRRDLRATWPQALLTFLAPLLLIFCVRWLLIEPYVIPSGSMIPTLLINDHIFVNKLSYGVHWPFSKSWLSRWSQPKRYDIVVFRYPLKPEVFYIKRIVGLPGDRIAVKASRLFINGEEIPRQRVMEGIGSVPDQEEGFTLFDEQGHVIRHLFPESEFAETEVPEGHFFAMGDNRDQSSDSRVWGPVPLDHILGRASFIWLSCEETLATARFLCDPRTIRWDRIFRSVN